MTQKHDEILLKALSRAGLISAPILFVAALWASSLPGANQSMTVLVACFAAFFVGFASWIAQVIIRSVSSDR
ncbi:hypothetical protein B0I08_101478 [Glaciihabitans tibetensis]|uniref:Uncharacterized protein n=1 Tax=Glaciihabitans tibetensis TaxID=1266600 RepID=A0A2T0VJG5_9MICO|nr:hypothetical protein [Glaciihabitans tibetensis]PRY70344.1 hypothetical protein B0I08_101478 [Glaciihabitans tibetensis]